MIVVQTGSDDFFIAGSALTVTISKDVDSGNGMAGIAGVEEGSRVQGQWETKRRLNGDQNDQGRNVFLTAPGFKLLRLKLYTIPYRPDR